MFKPGDRVQVKRSNSGYKGPAEVVDIAFSQNYLVKPLDTFHAPIILVPFTSMVHDRGGPERVPKSKPQDQEPDDLDQDYPETPRTRGHARVQRQARAKGRRDR
jgi:hypothetical protein